jgi:hypothetical protein
MIVANTSCLARNMLVPRLIKNTSSGLVKFSIAHTTTYGLTSYSILVRREGKKSCQEYVGLVLQSLLNRRSNLEKVNVSSSSGAQN